MNNGGVQMENDSITTTVRRARQLTDGSWHTVELTAERPYASLDEARELAAGLDALVVELLGGRERAAAPEPAPEVQQGPDLGACPDHGINWTQYSRDGRTWRSHRIEGGGWCNEQSLRV